MVVRTCYGRNRSNTQNEVREPRGRKRGSGRNGAVSLMKGERGDNQGGRFLGRGREEGDSSK